VTVTVEDAGRLPPPAPTTPSTAPCAPPDSGRAGPIDWQRCYAKVRTCLDDGATLDEIRPGVTVGGENIGLWLARQRTGWEQLADGQRERLAALGVEPSAGSACQAEDAHDLGLGIRLEGIPVQAPRQPVAEVRRALPG